MSEKDRRASTPRSEIHPILLALTPLLAQRFVDWDRMNRKFSHAVEVSLHAQYKVSRRRLPERESPIPTRYIPRLIILQFCARLRPGLRSESAYFLPGSTQVNIIVYIFLLILQILQSHSLNMKMINCPKNKQALCEDHKLGIRVTHYSEVRVYLTFDIPIPKAFSGLIRKGATGQQRSTMLSLRGFTSQGLGLGSLNTQNL